SDPGACDGLASDHEAQATWLPCEQRRERALGDRRAVLRTAGPEGRVVDRRVIGRLALVLVELDQCLLEALPRSEHLRDLGVPQAIAVPEAPENAEINHFGEHLLQVRTA